MWRVGTVALIGARLAAAGAVSVDPDDPATCAPCHEAVVAEWRESLHARAHHALDPLYGAMRALRIAKEGPGIAERCALCHTPRDPRDHESSAARTGVACATCHQLTEVRPGEGRIGARALVAEDRPLFRGPHDLPDGRTEVHGTGAALAALRDGTTLCLACHAEERNPAGVPMCTTGVEHRSEEGARSCTSCHMPPIEAPSGAVSARASHRSHRFEGPHLAHRRDDPGLLADGVAVTGRFDGSRLVVTLDNRTGHGFPTGFPGRMAVVELRGFDDAGAEVYRNVRDEPLAEHAEAVLSRRYADAEGRPVLAPFATRLAADTRLAPRERRELSVEVPASVRRAEMRLRFYLAGPPIARALRYAGPETVPLVLPPVAVAR